MAKVSKTPTCWLWQGSTTGSGYGQFWDGTRNIQAHWFLLENRPIKGEEACHTCDNKLCVNPSHVFIGTKSDNMRDMVSKGRHNTTPGALAMLKVRNFRGSRNPQSKLTDADVSTIMAAPKERGIQAALARKFNVTQACISAIRVGKNRKWEDGK